MAAPSAANIPAGRYVVTVGRTGGSRQRGRRATRHGALLGAAPFVAPVDVEPDDGGTALAQPFGDHRLQAHVARTVRLGDLLSPHAVPTARMHHQAALVAGPHVV